MLTVSKKEFRRKIEAGLNSSNTQKEDDKLPEKMIEEVTTDVEVNDEELDTKKSNIEEKAKFLANKIKETAKNKSKPNKDKSSRSRRKEYFNINVKSKAKVRGVKFRGHKGIEITNFEYEIKTKSNAAFYDKCEVFLGDKDDNFDIWGKYVGKLKQPVRGGNGGRNAKFEFYLRGKNLTVTYWKSHKYQDKAKAMATRAISLIKQALNA